MALLRIILAIVALALASPAMAQGDMQAQFRDAVASQTAGDHRRAVELFYALLERMRAEGRGESGDAGIVTAHLAESLLATGHPQAEDAYAAALDLLWTNGMAEPFVALARGVLERAIAAKTFERAVELSDVLMRLAATPDIPEIIVAHALEAAAAAYRHAERHEAADAALARSLALTGTDPFTSHLRGVARMTEARAAQGEGRFADMDAAVEAGLADLRRAGPEGAKMIGPMLVIRSQHRYDEGRYRLALEAVDEALAALDRDAAPESAWRQAIVLKLRMLERLDRVAEAVALADGIVADVARSHGDGAPIVLGARLDRAELLIRADRLDDAEAELTAIATELERQPSPLLIAGFHQQRGMLMLRQGHYADAVQSAEEAIRIRREVMPDARGMLVEPMRLRADASDGMQDPGFAEAAYRELIALSEEVHSAGHPEVATDLNSYSLWLKGRWRFAEAEAIQRRVAEMIERAYGPQSAKYAYVLANLAEYIVPFAGRTEEAIEVNRRAIAIADALPDEAAAASGMRSNMAGSLLRLGRNEEAIEVIEQARAGLGGLSETARARRHFLLDGLTMQALAAMGRAAEAVAVGERMLAWDGAVTQEDIQNVAVALTKFAQIANGAGNPAAGAERARQAMAATSALGFGTGYVYREAALALIDGAWGLARP